MKPLSEKPIQRKLFRNIQYLHGSLAYCDNTKTADRLRIMFSGTLIIPMDVTHSCSRVILGSVTPAQQEDCPQILWNMEVYCCVQVSSLELCPVPAKYLKSYSFKIHFNGFLPFMPGLLEFV
jgi:hypothetical protein